MSDTFPQTKPAPSWQDEIRAREEEARLAFLKPDLTALAGIFADALVVNSPLQRLMTRPLLFEALRTGRIRHLEHEAEIEYLSRYGDMIVVMGNDRVVDPPDRAVSHRRFTNVWSRQDGAWLLVARHAHIVSREAGQK